LAVLSAAGYVAKAATDVVCIGELALDGKVRPVRGALGAALIAKRHGMRCVLPTGSGSAAWNLEDVDLRAVADLPSALAAALGDAAGEPDPPPADIRTEAPDMAEVRGMGPARRALEIAAAGGHHLLLNGPPGAGKTMLARCLPGIMPPLSADAGLEVAMAWAAAGRARAVAEAPPFRAPHHSATLAALVGGGSGMPVPGEVSLAHRGVLFLDELGEFPAHMLDALRQPLEDGEVVIARKGASVSFPCRFQLVATTNPCPCGYRGDRLVACKCPPGALERYGRRLSGPLADRIDLRVPVQRLEPAELVGPPGEAAATVRRRVLAARKRQQERGDLNRDLRRSDLDGLRWEQAATEMLESAMTSMALSARGWDRVRRVAVTIADLDESTVIGDRHVAEAMAFRGRS
jgi:magnesium chelatase family protein